MGLVEQHADAAGQDHRERLAKALGLRLAVEVDAFRAKVGDRRREVVAHEADLVLRLVSGLDAELGGRRVDAELGRRQLEDEPPGMRLDELQPERVAERRAQRFRLRSVEQHVRADDCHQRFLTSATSFVIESFASPNSITVFGL